jgi:glycosyltransferase involved in cell wall biosynthesis
METLQSVLQQSYPVDEFVIVDDGSTDNLRDLLADVNDPRIKYYYFERVGCVSKLRNLAIQKSSCDVLAFIDSDDLWHADKIKKHVAAMEAHEAFIVCADCQGFTEKGLMARSVGEHLRGTKVDVWEQLLSKNLSMAFGTNFFFRKYLDGGMVQLDERLVSGDHDLLVMLVATQKAVYIDEVLNYIRRHDGNVSAEGTVTSLISNLEYNRTAGKLLAQHLISKEQYKEIKAANYCKTAGYYLGRRRYRRSNAYLVEALKYHFRWYYLKILVKSVGLSIVS